MGGREDAEENAVGARKELMERFLTQNLTHTPHCGV